MIRSGFYNFSGAFVRQGMTFLSIPILIHLIGTEEYGLWALVSSILGIAGLAESGLSLSTIVFLAQDLENGDDKEISQTLTVTVLGILTLATLCSSLLFIYADQITHLFGNLKSNQELVVINSIKIGAPLLWTRLLQQVCNGIEQAYKRYDGMTILSTIYTVLINIGMIGVASQGLKVVALMQWCLVVNVFTLLAHIIFVISLMRQINLCFAWDRYRSLEIIKYSISTWALTLGGALFQQGDKLIVGALLGSKILGIYATLTSITVQINILSATVVQPVIPEVSAVNLVTKKDRTLIIKNLVSAFYLNIFVALGLGQIMLIIAPIIVNIFLPENLSSRDILFFRLMIIIYGIYSLSAVGYYTLLGLRLTKLTLFVQLGSGSIALLLIYILSIPMGLPGALIGNLGYVGVCLINYAAIKKMDIVDKIFLKPTIDLILYFLLFSTLILLVTISQYIHLIILCLNFSLLLINNFLSFRKAIKVQFES